MFCDCHIKQKQNGVLNVANSDGIVRVDFCLSRLNESHLIVCGQLYRMYMKFTIITSFLFLGQF